MSALAEPVPRKLKRWHWIGLTAVLVTAAAGFSWWWLATKAQLEARRPFFGTWRLESPTDPARPGQVWDIGLRPDGTVDIRRWNPVTGAVAVDVKAQYRWRVVDGRLQQGHYGHTGLNNLGIGPWGFVLHDGPVTWEGPDRFRYQDEKLGRGPQVWVRIDGAGG
jgi:hypothetical protein